MKINLNVDLNIKNQKWSSISKHVDRNHEDYSNQNIRKDMSKLNENLTQADGNKLIRQHYLDYIKRHDEPIKQGKSRAKPYKSVKGFLKRKHMTPERTWVIKLGSSDDVKPLIHRLAQKMASPLVNPHTDGYTHIDKAKRLYIEACSRGFEDYADGFNKRNGHYMKMAEAETNVDETSPHLHARIIPLGFNYSKRRGKVPTGNQTKALEEEYNDKNNRTAMRHLHQFEDPIFLKDMSNAFSKVFGFKVDFQLSRSHNGYHGLGENQYEDFKKHETAERKEAELQFQRLERVLHSLKSQNSSLKAENQKLGNEAVDQNSVEQADKYVDSLVKQNSRLKSQLSN